MDLLLFLRAPRIIYTRGDSRDMDSFEDLANKTVSLERGYYLYQILSINWDKYRFS